MADYPVPKVFKFNGNYLSLDEEMEDMQETDYKITNNAITQIANFIIYKYY